MAKALAIIEEAGGQTPAAGGLARDLEDLTGKSVTVIRDVLTRKVAKKSSYRKGRDGKTERVDPDMRLLALQTQTALEVVKARIRVDETAFKERRADRLMPIMEALLGGQVVAEPEPAIAIESPGDDDEETAPAI